jgi:hypothetical protein
MDCKEFQNWKRMRRKKRDVPRRKAETEKKRDGMI